MKRLLNRMIQLENVDFPVVLPLMAICFALGVLAGIGWAG